MEKSSRSLWLYVHQGAWYVGRNFCGYLILQFFFPNRKYSQNIEPANNSNNKVDLILLGLKNSSLTISSQYVGSEKKCRFFLGLWIPGNKVYLKTKK